MPTEDPTASLPPEPSSSGAPERIGPYTILEPIGEGGFGVVYIAQQTEPVRRRVALKVIKPGMDSKAVVARFEAERQALAVMDHPCIAKVLDAGATDRGLPYFVMELVKGDPINEFCDANRLTVVQRVELMIRACEAVQHAHSKGVIHRDLKPSNVLVGYDGQGRAQPKVIDFGIAKALTMRLSEATIYTQRGQLIGTPEYMSPEQAEMSGQDIDTRADVYSLGVVLYQLLTGILPFESKELRDAGFTEVQRIIREKEPPRPSNRLSTLLTRDAEMGTRIAELRRLDTGSLRRLISRDLDWIVMRCLEKDRERRYDTANALAMELQRYLDDEPVLAGPPSARYKLGKFVKRNRAGVIAGSVGTAALFLAAIVSVAFAIEAERARRDTERMNETLREQNRLAVEGLTRVMQATGVYESIERDVRSAIEDGNTNYSTEMGVEMSDGTFLIFEARSNESGEVVFRPDRAIRPDGGGELTGHDLESVIAASIADVAATTASDALEAERERAEQLQLVADFQAEQLGAIDPELMGTRLRAALLESANEEQRASLERALAGVNFTSLALGSLEENIFERTIEAIDEQFADQPLVRARLLQTIADTLASLGLLEMATDPQARALAIRRRVLGDDHPDTLTSVNDMGVLLWHQGKLEEAEACYREALVDRRVLGDDHPDTLTCVNNMGVLLLQQGKLEEAEPYFREALERKRRVLGDDHPDTLASVINMGSLLSEQGKLEEAEPYHREAIEGYRRVLGDDHPVTLRSVINMGSLLSEQGNLKEAEPYYREALEGSRRVLGDDHPDTLTSVSNMGVLLWRQGKLGEAEPYFREALEGSRRVLGNDHADTLIGISNLALLLADLERGEKALALADEAVERGRAVLGHEHQFIGNFLGKRGRALEELGRLAEAEQDMLEAHAILVAALGESHVQTTRVVGYLIDLYTAWHEAEPGKAYDAKAAEWRAKLDETRGAKEQ